MLAWYDYLIVVIPVAYVMWMAWYVRRYIKGVSDFVSAGRLCGRYLIAVSHVANALSIITLLSYVEIHYKTGFALAFWNKLLVPITIFLGLTGYCTYRFRETKSMSIGQFIEMRYSRNLRMFASTLRSISEILANMIMPALAARFFINFLDLPQHFTICGITFSTFLVIMLISLTLAIGIILLGGMLSIIVTDSLQGLFLYPLLVLFVIFILTKFSWSQEIGIVMMDRVEGESFINPMDIHKLRDFNFLVFGVTVVATFVHTASWFASGSTVARSAHEQKMAGILGTWRGALSSIFYVLIAVAVITVLNHKNFASEAKTIRTSLVESVAKDIVKDEAIRGQIIENANAIPEHTHTYKVDPPLSDKNNLDTPYLDAAQEVLKQQDGGTALYTQFRALYKQLMPTVTLRHILPHGMLGLFLLLMIMAMISTDDSRIYSAAATITQDLILPLKKKPFTPEQHLWVIRIVTIGIGIIFLFGSYYMSQLDYIQMFVTIMTSLWLGGCGPVMVFGLYSRFGTTIGAWTSLLTGMVLSGTGIFFQRNWADHIYPFLEKHGWVEPVGSFLSNVSKPFNPIIIWEMKADRFPINSYEIYLATMIVCIILYVVVSKLTMKEPFNLERMLHRGIYSDDPNKIIPKTDWSVAGICKRLIGITPQYTKNDKLIAYGMFIYNMGYGFLICFILVVCWNAISPWKIEWWSNFYRITLLIVPAIVSAVTVVWFGIGGVKDMLQLFKDLKQRIVNNLDDGRVEGNVSLADKAQFEQLEKEQLSQKK